jgi:hypothetical protein
MNRMPQTDIEWRDYEADRLMARTIEMRKDLEKTHSLKDLIQMQVDATRSEREGANQIASQAVSPSSNPTE